MLYAYWYLYSQLDNALLACMRACAALRPAGFYFYIKNISPTRTHGFEGCAFKLTCFKAHKHVYSISSRALPGMIVINSLATV